MDDQPQVTALLHAWGEGDKSAFDRLTPLVYAELRRMAGIYLRRERAGHTLQPTALVHEAYLRLAGKDHPIESRAHFLAIAAASMRQILVDNARKFRAAKRGSGHTEELPEDIESGGRFIALDDALRDLAKLDERKARIVEMRHFGGLTSQEIAAVLGVSLPTVTRDVRMAEAWLYSYLKAR